MEVSGLSSFGFSRFRVFRAYNVQGLGFGVQGLRFRVQGSRLRVWGLGFCNFRVWGTMPSLEVPPMKHGKSVEVPCFRGSLTERSPFGPVRGAMWASGSSVR